jgi:hypothetical protein
MPALDRYHETVKRALIKDGWTITNDPYTLVIAPRFLYIDLRVEKTTDNMVILVEIKSFEQDSSIEALANAIGKYNLYEAALKLASITTPLYLALPEKAFTGIISEDIGRLLISQHNVRLMYD